MEDYSGMSFAQAFQLARKAAGGPGGVFMWRGRTYSTRLKTEPLRPLGGQRGAQMPPPARPGSAYEPIGLQLNPMGRENALAMGMENYGNMPLSPGDENYMPNMRGEEPSGWMAYGPPRTRW